MQFISFFCVIFPFCSFFLHIFLCFISTGVYIFLFSFFDFLCPLPVIARGVRGKKISHRKKLLLSTHTYLRVVWSEFSCFLPFPALFCFLLNQRQPKKFSFSLEKKYWKFSGRSLFSKVVWSEFSCFPTYLAIFFSESDIAKYFPAAPKRKVTGNFTENLHIQMLSGVSFSCFPDFPALFSFSFRGNHFFPATLEKKRK